MSRVYLFFSLYCILLLMFKKNNTYKDKDCYFLLLKLKNYNDVYIIKIRKEIKQKILTL